MIRGVFATHGFDEIETPGHGGLVAPHAGLGGDNEKLAFAVMKRGITPDDLAAAAASGDALSLADLGLRYDLTVPLARFYATHRAALPPVFRAIQIAPVWRASGRRRPYRQFVQCDIDIIGEPGHLAELELLTATVMALDALGLEGCRIRLNDRRILARILGSWGVPEELRERALITIDKLDKIGPDGVAAELATLGVDRAGVADELRALAAADWHLADGVVPPPAWLDLDAYRDLIALRDAVPGTGIDFDPTLVRGMGYYTGTIFEIAHPDYGYSLGGGGRYDHMIGRFLGQEVPAWVLDRVRAHRRPARRARRGPAARRGARVRRGCRARRLLVLKHSSWHRSVRCQLSPRKNLRALLDHVDLRLRRLGPCAGRDDGCRTSLAFRDLGDWPARLPVRGPRLTAACDSGILLASLDEQSGGRSGGQIHADAARIASMNSLRARPAGTRLDDASHARDERDRIREAHGGHREDHAPSGVLEQLVARYLALPPSRSCRRPPSYSIAIRSAG